MNDSRHITKNKFYEVIQNRLYEYREAIFGNSLSQPMSLMMLQSAQYSINQLKIIDSQINLFDSAFWGYGINNISVGNESYSHLDVEQIKRIGGLNKHHEDYRIFLLLIFKVEKYALFANFFSIDSCKPGFNSNLNIKYDLKNFDNAELKLRTNNNIFIEFFFKGYDQPISFQIEIYHVGGYLSGIQLAQYYVNKIKELANEAKNEENLNQNLDEISELNKKIDKIESELRSLIADTLINETGKNDFESLLSGEPKRDVRNRMKNYLDLHPNKTIEDFKTFKTISQFLDIDHLKKIILKLEYWSYFSLRFKNKEKVEKYFNQFSQLRHVIKHNREMSDLIFHEGKASIEWLEMVIDK